MGHLACPVPPSVASVVAKARVSAQRHSRGWRAESSPELVRLRDQYTGNVLLTLPAGLVGLAIAVLVRTGDRGALLLFSLMAGAVLLLLVGLGAVSVLARGQLFPHRPAPAGIRVRPRRTVLRRAGGRAPILAVAVGLISWFTGSAAPGFVAGLGVAALCGLAALARLEAREGSVLLCPPRANEMGGTLYSVMRTRKGDQAAVLDGPRNH